MRIDFEKVQAGNLFTMTTVMKADQCSIYQRNTSVVNGKAITKTLVKVEWVEDLGEYLYVGYTPAGKDRHTCKFGAARLYLDGPKEFGVVGFEAVEKGQSEKAIKTFADINKRFTEIVAEYLANGYAINTATMAGSQGEVGKVDLTDGAKVVRVLLDSFHDAANFSIEGLKIIVGEAEGIAPNLKDRGDTIWNNRLKVLSVECFYVVGKNRRTGALYGTREQAEAAECLRCARYISKWTSQTESIIKKHPKALEIAKRIIRREFGIKRIREEDVCFCKCDGAYVVTYHGKVYRLRNRREV